MERTHSEAPGTRLVFWAYAACTWAGGFLLAGWGPMWFGTDSPGQPFARAALIRVAGAALIAAGCFSAAMAQVADEDARRRGMLWFAVAHALLWLIVFSQQHTIWESPFVEKALFILFIPTFAFLFFRGEIDPSSVTLQTLFGVGERPAKAAASRHEREIRDAAGREERNRLARDLHDSIKQQLFAIQTAAATAQTRFEPDPEGARGAIAQVRTSAREAMTEMEVMLDQLRATPLENVGLVEALKRQCEAVGFRTGAKVEFELGELPPDSHLPPGAQQALFRIAQEALSNVARHARAANLRVTLSSVDSALKLTVDDDGAGFDPASPAPGMGIRNIRERAAEFGGVFELAGTPGAGTHLSVAIPFSSPATEREYVKKMWIEGIALVVLVVAAIVIRSGALAGFLVAWTFRFIRALMAWVDFRAAREAVH